MNTGTIEERARVCCTQVVVITINRGLIAFSSGFVATSIVAYINRITHHGLIKTLASFTTICCTKIIIIANNRLRNTRTSIHITVNIRTKVIVFTNKWDILATENRGTRDILTVFLLAWYIDENATRILIARVLSANVIIIAYNIYVNALSSRNITRIGSAYIIVVTVYRSMGTISRQLATSIDGAQIIIITVLGSVLTSKNSIATWNIAKFVVVTRNRSICTTSRGCIAVILGTNVVIVTNVGHKFTTRSWKTIVVGTNIVIITDNR
jgi:hypothetical protein